MPKSKPKRRSKTKPPATTRARVEAIRDALPEGFEWDERESALLALALAQAENIDALEADVAKHGVRTADELAAVDISSSRRQ